MPQGSKSSYSAKQKRQAEHIEKSYEKRGVSKKEAGERAWRTVNKATGGAKKKGMGPSRVAARSDSAKKAAATRKKRKPSLRQKGDKK